MAIVLPGSALTLLARLAGRFGSKDLADVMGVGSGVAGGHEDWGTTGGAVGTASGTRNDRYIIGPDVDVPIIGGYMTLDIVVVM